MRVTELFGPLMAGSATSHPWRRSIREGRQSPAELSGDAKALDWTKQIVCVTYGIPKGQKTGVASRFRCEMGVDKAGFRPLHGSECPRPKKHGDLPLHMPCRGCGKSWIISRCPIMRIRSRDRPSSEQCVPIPDLSATPVSLPPARAAAVRRRSS